ncbi:MAG: cardiolipin synthase, partial [Planctomycetota bacterium]|nr:cardiolipin synthase [Planctomycetota bacterium]
MLGSAWPVLAILGEFLAQLALIVFILLRRRPHSASTLAWIVVIVLLPLAGIIGYLLLGEVRLGRRRIRRHREIIERLAALRSLREDAAAVFQPHVPAPYRSIATLAEAVGNSSAVGGNQFQLISDTDLFIQSLVDDIDSAEHHCHLLFYIFLTDYSGRKTAEALMRAAKRGVACRLLVDAVGSRSFLKSDLRREMETRGVRVVEALHANLFRMLFARLDLRNHRKIAIIDGVIGYLGSHNIADAEFAIKRRFAPWIDAQVRVQGPVARDLQRLFIEDWFMDTDEVLEEALSIDPPIMPENVATQIMATGPNSYNEALRQLNLTAFHTAREELIVTTPYFVPDEATTMALRTAARRGVETTLIFPARNDSPLVAAASRSYYEPLLESGVRIYEYQKGLLHAKTLTLDRSLALITTANLDRRSFELNFEVSMLVFDSDFASELRFLQTSYLNDSRPV